MAERKNKFDPNIKDCVTKPAWPIGHTLTSLLRYPWLDQNVLIGLLAKDCGPNRNGKILYGGPGREEWEGHNWQWLIPQFRKT